MLNLRLPGLLASGRGRRSALHPCLLASCLSYLATSHSSLLALIIRREACAFIPRAEEPSCR